MIYDCVVIGAGITGLASSIILSKNGFKTALVEKAPKTGPLVKGFKRKGQYFDTGFHHAGGIGSGCSGQGYPGLPWCFKAADNGSGKP